MQRQNLLSGRFTLELSAVSDIEKSSNLRDCQKVYGLLLY
jgi:hypothetical protein